ncbi:MAG: hypothetical protein ACE5GW_07780, partial [Planctomycetota bacterium]
MPIQYRCRCGQEVTLRLREGIYLVAGLILGLTLLNTALTLFLWLRLTTEPPRRMADRGPLPTSEGLGAATSPAAGGGGAEAARAAEEASSSRSSELEDSRAGLRDQPPSPLVVAPPPEALPSRGLEREEPSPPAKEEEEKVEAQRRPLPRLHRFVRPASLEPLSLALLLDRLPERPIDRSLVLLGALRWGSGDLAGRARDLIPAHSPLLSALAPEWAPAGRGEGSSPPGALEISDEGLPWRSELLTSLEERWDEGWESLLRSAGGPHSLRWLTATRE